MNCISLLCLKPNKIWFDLLDKFTAYSIFVIIDDNNTNYTKQFEDYKNIKVVQIANNDCQQNGFTNMNFTIGKTISAWEKAMYYFSEINTQYDKIWFIEDDVFFYNEQTLINIDTLYKNSDLLSNTYSENSSGEKNSWLWRSININFPPPYYAAMVCCVRISKNLLSKIKSYAVDHKTLFFLESLFPTLCKKHNLIYDTPVEFKNIEYRKEFSLSEINKNSLFHPVKQITKHVDYREILGTCK
jgi:hypothetical protein